MTSEERRDTIVMAALPLFAKNGFARTTTRELAGAAQVSEALIYKHFPSKESLYAEIQAFVYRGRDQILQRLSALTPSTDTLVHVLYYVVRSNLVCCGTESVGMETRQRMLLNSCLEDGSFARFMFHNRVCDYMNQISASVDAALAAGDLLASPGRRQNAIYFAYHLATMVSTMHLPGGPVVDYGAPREDLLHEVVLFSLRGMGLKESAISRLYDPIRLAAFFSGETAIDQI
jgi:AcrR family transcriptional regulator